MAALTPMMASSSTAEQYSPRSEWGLLSEKTYARPRPSRSETAPATTSYSREPRQPSPLRTRPRSASPPQTLPPPSPSSSSSAELPSRPMVAYLPPSLPAQSLDAAMFQDMRSHRHSMVHRSSPLAKGVYTIYEAPITPPESPEPSIAEAIQQEAEEDRKGKGVARKLKVLARGSSTVSLPVATSSSAQPKADNRLCLSAPPSLRRRTSQTSLTPRPTPALAPAPPQEAKWLTEVAAPTFSRYHMGPGIVLPKPAPSTGARPRAVSMYEEVKAGPAAKVRKVEHEKTQKDHAHSHISLSAGLKPVASLASHLPLGNKRTSLFFSKAAKQTAVAAA